VRSRDHDWVHSPERAFHLRRRSPPSAASAQTEPRHLFLSHSRVAIASRPNLTRLRPYTYLPANVSLIHLFGHPPIRGTVRRASGRFALSTNPWEAEHPFSTVNKASAGRTGLADRCDDRALGNRMGSLPFWSSWAPL